MPIRQKCSGCGATLMLPDSGLGRCPRCKSVVRAAALEIQAAPSPEETQSFIPEISDEHMVAYEAGPAPPAAPISPDPLPATPPAPGPPPLPRPRRGERVRDVPPIDIAVPRPKPSKALPVALLSISLVLCLGMVVGSIIYLTTRARERPPPGMVFPRK